MNHQEIRDRVQQRINNGEPAVRYDPANDTFDFNTGFGFNEDTGFYYWNYVDDFRKNRRASIQHLRDKSWYTNAHEHQLIELMNQYL